MSSQEFNRDVSAAKRTANHEPVFITDRGKTKHVLLSIEDYEKHTGQRATGTRLSQRLRMDLDTDQDIDLDIEPRRIENRPAAL